MIKIYIASPYTKGDKEANVHNAMAAADELIKAGFLPIQPLLHHYFDKYYPQDYSFYLKAGLGMVTVADAVLRLPGESVGADLEEYVADLNNILVFDDIPTLIDRAIIYGVNGKRMK